MIELAFTVVNVSPLNSRMLFLINKPNEMILLK